MELFLWFNDVFLKMNWLKEGIEAIVAQLGMDPLDQIGASLVF